MHLVWHAVEQSGPIINQLQGWNGRNSLVHLSWVPHILSPQWSHLAKRRTLCCWKLCLKVTLGFSGAVGPVAGNACIRAFMPRPSRAGVLISFPLNHANFLIVFPAVASESDFAPFPYLASSRSSAYTPLELIEAKVDIVLEEAVTDVLIDVLELSGGNGVGLLTLRSEFRGLSAPCRFSS
jgi:hypothetical protein